MTSQTRLFVGNLPENTDENALRNAFGSYGVITNFELKTKPNAEQKSNKFAFITLSTNDYYIESCLKHFSINEFSGSRLYVTKARESFLERLQRERQQAQQNEIAKNEEPVIPKTQPVIKLSEKLNPCKKAFDSNVIQNGFHNETIQNVNKKSDFHENTEIVQEEPIKFVRNKSGFPTRLEQKNLVNEKPKVLTESDKKKQDADKKRIESIKKKRQEFKQKQMILKIGLVDIDKVQNKKVVFSDSDDETQLSANEKREPNPKVQRNQSHNLFDNEDSGDEVNFEVKEQFEGKKGQKVLELQSRYKSDKRFMLDERFVENDDDVDEPAVEISHSDEKHKQLNILQDVLGIAIKSSARQPSDLQDRKRKSKPGMLRFDPSQPEHSKFLAPVVEKPQEPLKKKKKKGKDKTEDEIIDTPIPQVPAVEVSKEQFYQVSETLKEAIAQPTSFSLRSLFSKSVDDDEVKEQTSQKQTYTPIGNQKVTKVKNPLDPGEHNPFRYDSSDSEDEEVTDKVKDVAEVKAVKTMWKEKLFFAKDDHRLFEGLSFFNEEPEKGFQKDRREMKFVMKKRLQNKERKEHENMFKKKIGGRRKTQKKSYRKRN